MPVSHSILVRKATFADFSAITEIYGHNCLYGTGTFALEPATPQEMMSRWHEIRQMDLPYLVAVEGDNVLGFAYASPFRTRPGYRYGIEDSIYIHPDHHGKGIGKALLSELVTTTTTLGYYTMIAVIGDGENAASIAVHKSMGFVETGRLPNAGYKLDRWLDVVFMCRELRPLDNPPVGTGWSQ
ncbi:GNAT family N-acetyltransferase [Asticcacaulis sp. ZE23SCel15]|uniref:GNAT family N-acetyltransferase n=1 Tax=Asticcacaulis sp. ZE23SCel15 TaxID=3059027 RepID=UPI00265D9070|nr:GNAT family N-acetyltransferase [Asticcacaulis sp. ZE23SCel15]WKL56770.1 GNAT family N-acetyltransferase [Asticcacaulis sp. ZE23SCel15]